MEPERWENSAAPVRVTLLRRERRAPVPQASAPASSGGGAPPGLTRGETPRELAGEDACGTAKRQLRARCRHAFTLIELLVVIAVIGTLASLLLPALANGRTRVRRAACLNNLRQTHLSFLTYAHDYDNAVPIGYRGGRKQWNTMIYSGTVNKFVTFGRLYVAQLMAEPRIFYCPAETATSQNFNTVDNPWPPGITGTNVQGGYASTPIVDWGANEFPIALPRLDELARQALLADGTGTPDRVDSRHRDGANVLYTDGGAQWVPRAFFDQPLSQCAAITPACNPQQDAIWSVFNAR